MALDKKILFEEIANQLRANVALVNIEGKIEYANSQWEDFTHKSGNRQFAQSNPEPQFLDVCLHEDGENRLALEELQEVLSGQRDSYELEYPCLCNPDKRWFLMRVVSQSPLERGALIFHIDITQRKMAEKQRHAICLLQTEFLSKVSHELRNPLNTIMGYTQLFQKDAGPNLTKNQSKYLTQIIRAGNLLNSLLADLPDPSRKKAGAWVPSHEKVSLQEILEESSNMVLPLAEQKTVRLNIVYPDSGDLTVNIDALRLKQILINLLSNAIKYNLPQGEVNLSYLESPQGELLLVVEDTGPGIPKDQVPNLFEPYFRLNSNPPGIPGSGLGLSITQDLVSVLGGRIQVYSEPGKGSRFTVILPR